VNHTTKQKRPKTTKIFLKSFVLLKKYMHVETPRLAEKTIVYSEHEVF
jgi:hypothetical protein